MRLYRALCAWLEASAAAMSEPDEYGPEGAGQAQAEHAHSYTTPPELHVRSDRQSIDDDEGGSYRVSMPRSAVTGRYIPGSKRPIGFVRNP